MYINQVFSVEWSFLTPWFEKYEHTKYETSEPYVSRADFLFSRLKSIFRSGELQMKRNKTTEQLYKKVT